MQARGECLVSELKSSDYPLFSYQVLTHPDNITEIFLWLIKLKTNIFLLAVQIYFLSFSLDFWRKKKIFGKLERGSLSLAGSHIQVHNIFCGYIRLCLIFSYVISACLFNPHLRGHYNNNQPELSWISHVTRFYNLSQCILS